MLQKSFLLISLGVFTVIGKFSLGGIESRTPYHLTAIKGIESAYFGAHRVYFDLAGNEQYLDVLTQRTSPQSLKVGVLTQFRNSNCTQPPRETFVRVRLGQNQVETVTAFDEVRHCSGICYVISDPEVSPYRPVHAYGTSEAQAREEIPCYPEEQINMVCKQIEVTQQKG